MNNVTDTVFAKKRHVKFLLRCLDILPAKYGSADSNKMTLAFFSISGLDMLNSLSVIDDKKQDIINWVYALQVLPGPSGNHYGRSGFQGSFALGGKFKTNQKTISDEEIPSYVCGHLAMTYTALSILIILGDDLAGVNYKAIIESLKSVQLDDGSFQPCVDGGENDMRFLYCACCISYILQDWSGINIPRAVQYISLSQSYEGGFGQGPGLEAHGGSVFCSIASLYLMNELDVLNEKQLNRLRQWCIMRQKSGFQGRPNKPEDSCYSFWIGATLKLINANKFVNMNEIEKFMLSTQDSIIGGFSKWPDSSSDILHTYLSIVGLSLIDFPEIATVHPALNFSERAYGHLSYLHTKMKADN
ncbi:Geranylgeranyl transferase type-1 subunit beta [Nymphon striatum]|nr:Geranylgeranyl transferase type-1 subunit beta [Nymphon striatum]